MNERIKEIILEHGLGKLGCTSRMEMLAELIVKECAKVCDTIGKEARKEWKTKYIPHDDGRADGAWQCEEAILEHFGVNDES